MVQWLELCTFTAEGPRQEGPGSLRISPPQPVPNPQDRPVWGGVDFVSERLSQNPMGQAGEELAPGKGGWTAEQTRSQSCILTTMDAVPELGPESQGGFERRGEEGCSPLKEKEQAADSRGTAMPKATALISSQ